MPKARALLAPQGRWEELRAALVALSEQFNSAVEGGFLAPSEYLLAHGRK